MTGKIETAKHKTFTAHLWTKVTSSLGRLDFEFIGSTGERGDFHINKAEHLYRLR